MQEKIKKPLTISKNITIVNNKGLHARASAKFVTMVNRMPQTISIFVVKDEQKVTGNSIMGLMMLGAAKANNIDIIIEYEKINEQQAHQALNRLTGLVLDGFGED